MGFAPLTAEEKKSWRYYADLVLSLRKKESSLDQAQQDKYKEEIQTARTHISELITKNIASKNFNFLSQAVSCGEDEEDLPLLAILIIDSANDISSNSVFNIFKENFLSAIQEIEINPEAISETMNAIRQMLFGKDSQEKTCWDYACETCNSAAILWFLSLKKKVTKSSLSYELSEIVGDFYFQRLESDIIARELNKVHVESYKNTYTLLMDMVLRLKNLEKDDAKKEFIVAALALISKMFAKDPAALKLYLEIENAIGDTAAKLAKTEAGYVMLDSLFDEIDDYFSEYDFYLYLLQDMVYLQDVEGVDLLLKAKVPISIYEKSIFSSGPLPYFFSSLTPEDYFELLERALKQNNFYLLDLLMAAITSMTRVSDTLDRAFCRDKLIIWVILLNYVKKQSDGDLLVYKALQKVIIDKYIIKAFTAVYEFYYRISRQVELIDLYISILQDLMANGKISEATELLNIKISINGTHKYFFSLLSDDQYLKFLKKACHQMDPAELRLLLHKSYLRITKYNPYPLTLYSYKELLNIALKTVAEARDTDKDARDSCIKIIELLFQHAWQQYAWQQGKAKRSEIKDIKGLYLSLLREAIDSGNDITVEALLEVTIQDYIGPDPVPMIALLNKDDYLSLIQYVISSDNKKDSLALLLSKEQYKLTIADYKDLFEQAVKNLHSGKLDYNQILFFHACKKFKDKTSPEMVAIYVSLLKLFVDNASGDVKNFKRLLEIFQKDHSCIFEQGPGIVSIISSENKKEYLKILAIAVKKGSPDTVCLLLNQATMDAITFEDYKILVRMVFSVDLKMYMVICEHAASQLKRDELIKLCACILDDYLRKEGIKERSSELDWTVNIDEETLSQFIEAFLNPLLEEFPFFRDVEIELSSKLSPSLKKELAKIFSHLICPQNSIPTASLIKIFPSEKAREAPPSIGAIEYESLSR